MTAPPTTSFRHEAFLYRNDAEYAAGVGEFVTEALQGRRRVLVAVSTDRADVVSRVLGPTAKEVEFVDMAELGRNPGRILPAFHSFLDAHAGEEIGFVCEPVWPGRSAAETSEAIRHEALVNRALARAPVHALCAYHVGALDGAVVFHAYRTHPVVRVDGQPETSHTFAEPEHVWRSVSCLPAAPQRARAVQFDLSSMSLIRGVAREEASHAGLPADRADDLVVAASEVAGNSVRHGGGSGLLRIWHEPDAVVCEVCDQGRLPDLMVGRHRPGPTDEGGWGLWLTNQLCDLVQLHCDESGTTVRFRMRR